MNRPKAAKAESVSPIAVQVVALAVAIGLNLAAPKPTRAVDRLVLPDGRESSGILAGDEASGFRFLPEDGGEPVAIVPGSTIRFDPEAPTGREGSAPFRLKIGFGGVLSGQVGGLDGAGLQFHPAGIEMPIKAARAGILGLEQPKGETRVFDDPFEAFDPHRWPIRVGEIRLQPGGGLGEGGGRALRMPSSSAAITHRFDEPIAAGRVEAAFYDEGRVAEGRRWFIDLGFSDGAGELAPARAVLGWETESYSVYCPRGPRLTVHRLSRTAGWHRFSARFGPNGLILAVDDSVLASGPGPAGSLVELRIGSSEEAGAPVAADLAARVDDLSVARSIAPTGPIEEVADQDSVRLASGDQIFGAIAAVDDREVQIEVAGSTLALPWSEVAGLSFRRESATRPAVVGWITRATWRSGPNSRELDQVEGALVAISETALTLDVPDLGPIALPRDRVEMIEPRYRAVRIVLDPHPRHLGDRYVPDLVPQRPEPGPLVLGFDLPNVPAGPNRLAIDVEGLIGRSGTPRLSDLVRAGAYRTRLVLNGTRLDDLNESLEVLNPRPDRVFVAIPDGLLVEGRNVLRFEQVGTEQDPSARDNFGLLGLAVESPRPDRSGGAVVP